jgi:alpha-tubulin suppressor-like RCC1 family protein
VQALFGTYALRVDGKLLHETPASNGAQTPVVDASTGLPLSGVVSVGDGLSHGCAAVADGGVVCWRTAAATGNADGQIGNGATDTTGAVYRATPVLTAANTPLTNVKAMATADYNSSCAITKDGKLYCWGDLTWLVNKGTLLHSGYAQAITTDGATPLSGVLQASTLSLDSCAVIQGASAREVWCWGYNVPNFLGLGDTTNRQYPTKVLGVTNPSKVVVGQQNNTSLTATCVLDGENVRCWGLNVNGQTGVGNTNSPVGSPALVTVENASALTGVIDLSYGIREFCALRAGNTLWCWGAGTNSYATNYGVTNVTLVGSPAGGEASGTGMRFLTSDGVYHLATVSRTPNCGVL